jgi:hypothetical protein
MEEIYKIGRVELDGKLIKWMMEGNIRCTENMKYNFYGGMDI